MRDKGYHIISSLALYLLLTTDICSAQKLFSEGVLTYKVNVASSSAIPADDVQESGTYILTVKGKQFKKELKLGNGFTTTIIYDEDKSIAYSLKDAGGKKYAIQLDYEQVKKQSEKFENFNLSGTGEKESIAGYECKKGIVTYNDKTSAEIVYTEQWKPQPFMYDRFPAIQVLPVDFSMKTDEDIILHFHVKKIDTSLVENSNFKIPIDYKIITSAEYHELK